MGYGKEYIWMLSEKNTIYAAGNPLFQNHHLWLLATQEKSDIIRYFEHDFKAVQNIRRHHQFNKRINKPVSSLGRNFDTV